MSRAFVKEDAQGPDEDPSERPLSSLPNYCTPRGIKLYQDEEARIASELEGFAGAQENPERKKRKRTLERDLRWVRARLEAAIPVDPANLPKDQIRFGASVVLKDAAGKEKKLQIVGVDEADEAKGLLTWASPLADSMLGLKAGQTLDWNGETWTVLSINY